MSGGHDVERDASFSGLFTNTFYMSCSVVSNSRNSAIFLALDGGAFDCNKYYAVVNDALNLHICPFKIARQHKGINLLLHDALLRCDHPYFVQNIRVDISHE